MKTKKLYCLVFSIIIILVSAGPSISADDDSILVIFSSGEGGGASSSSAGWGLSFEGDSLNVNVDNSTIEINSDILRVKAGGITGTQIANGAISGTHIATDSATAARIYNILPDIPTVTSIVPPSVIVGYSSFTATITGTNFETYAQAKIGTTELTSENVTSTTSMTATVPAGLALGTYNVTVRNWWESATATRIFEVKPSFPTTGLVSYYKLDETSGTTAYASYGSYNGTANNSRVFTTSVSGKINQCADFTGGNDEIALGTWNPGAQLTISMWFNPVSLSVHLALISKRDTWSQSGMMWQLNLLSTSEIEWRSTTSINYFGGTGININNWYHLVLVRNETNDIVYINGSNIGIKTKIEFGTKTDAQIRVGSCTYEYFNGYIDEVGIWNRALTTEEIAQLYNSGNGLPYP